MVSYTPTTDEVREAWLTAEYEERGIGTSDDDLRREFNRWLLQEIERAEYSGYERAVREGLHR